LPQPPLDIDSIHAFPVGEHGRAVRVQEERHLDGALAALGLERGRPALVLVGGAGDLPDDQGLDSLFAEIVALCERLRASVVDGGTDAGIMQLVGKARAAARAQVPLVGVAAEGTVLVPGVEPACEDAYPLEPNHSHFVLVPGSEWGDEVPWLGRVAEALAGGASVATVLVNGGDVARRDVEASVEAGRAVVVVAGSGRAADELAGEADGGSLASGLVVVAAPAAVPGELARLLGGRS
jgi:glycosyltransferase involved in cell wall biosynthesis